MNELEVQTFLAIVDSGSISAAAKILYLTQPAITRRIQKLEESLGYPLIVRGQGERTVTLTEQGKFFVGYAEKILSLYSDMRQISKIGKHQIINLAAPATIDIKQVVHAMNSYKMRHPNSTVILHTRHSYNAASGINSGNLDLAVVARLTHISKINYIPISNEPYQLVTHWNYKPEISAFSPSELDPDKEIRMPWDFAYESWHNYWFGEDQLPFAKVDRLSAVSLLLGSKEGWTILPERAARSICGNPDFSIRKLDDAPSNLTLYLIQKKHNSDPLLLSEFAKCFHVSDA